MSILELNNLNITDAAAPPVMGRQRRNGLANIFDPHNELLSVGSTRMNCRRTAVADIHMGIPPELFQAIIQNGLHPEEAPSAPEPSLNNQISESSESSADSGFISF